MNGVLKSLESSSPIIGSNFHFDFMHLAPEVTSRSSYKMGKLVIVGVNFEDQK